MNLNNVIEQIKKEGVEEANSQAQNIISEAQKQAKDILKKAEEEKTSIIEKANKEKESLINNGKSALEQAQRDTIIALKGEIIKVLDNIVKKEISSSMDQGAIKEILIKMVTSDNALKGKELDLLLGEKDKEALRGIIEKELQNEMKKGLSIKVSPNIKQGFMIGEKDQNVFYDFTDDAVAEALNAYLNKKVREILDKE